MAAAFAAAHLLVLQTVLAAYALGANPHPSLLDAFGNVICTQDSAAGQTPGAPHGGHPADCCTLGCNLAATGLAPPPATQTLPDAFAFDIAGFGAQVQPFIFSGRDRSPANPRAPPLAA